MTKPKKGPKNGKPTRCEICGEKLQSGKALGGHMSKHTKAAKRSPVPTWKLLAVKAVKAAKVVKRAKRKKIISGGKRIQTPFGMADIVPTIGTPNSFRGPSLLQSLLPAAEQAKKLKDAHAAIVSGLREAANKKRNEARDLDVLANTAEKLL